MINLWLAGAVTAGDVVLVSALTFRILHGSRDLALVDAPQQIGAIDDTLRIIVQPHALYDPDSLGRHFNRVFKPRRRLR